MTSHALNLLFVRLAGILTQGFLLVAATVLFAFGMLELFQSLSLGAVVLAWLLFLPAASGAFAAHEFEHNTLSEKLDARGVPALAGSVALTAERYTRLRSFLVRARARKHLSLPRSRWDLSQAIVTTATWSSFLVFVASVTVHV